MHKRHTKDQVTLNHAKQQWDCVFCLERQTKHARRHQHILTAWEEQSKGNHAVLTQYESIAQTAFNLIKSLSFRQNNSAKKDA